MPELYLGYFIASSYFRHIKTAISLYFVARLVRFTVWTIVMFACYHQQQKRAVIHYAVSNQHNSNKKNDGADTPPNVKRVEMRLKL